MNGKLPHWAFPDALLSTGNIRVIPTSRASNNLKFRALHEHPRMGKSTLGEVAAVLQIFHDPLTILIKGGPRVCSNRFYAFKAEHHG